MVAFPSLVPEMRMYSRVPLTAAVYVTVTALACSADKPPTGPELSAAPKSNLDLSVGPHRSGDIVPNSYLVKLKKERATSPSITELLAGELVRKRGGTLTFLYENLRGYAVDNLSNAAVDSLRADPAVEYVEPNRIAEVSVTAITQSNPGNGLDRLDQAYLPLSQSFTYAYDGTGVNVYILDSGVDTTVGEFSGRIGVGKACVPVPYNLVPHGNDPYYDIEQIGHGTAVASVAVGTTYGVAKKAILHSVRISGNTGHGISTDAAMTCGINWVASFGVRPAVASMSVGGIPSSFSVRDAINNVTVTANIPFVKAAGNDSTDAYLDRGNRATLEWVVGATNPVNDQIASFSNYGVSAAPSVNMFAPGVSIRAADKYNPGFPQFVSGTSFAAPMVAGVIAQYLQVSPTATNQVVFDAINNYMTTYGIVQGLVGVRATSPNKMLHSVLWCAIPAC
jgi:aqualysin 1